ncbi:MAG: hypothetical protein JSU79_10170 [Dehalococcoidales bacterium]|nr:MAG: hypothetical protein JSU79_10170 [Dehalococcoidales bacterium]
MLSGFKTYLKVAWACKTPLVLILDKEYTPISTDILNQIATEISDNFEYIKNIADCDDAALLLKAKASEQKENSVGLIFGKTLNGLHAWNLAMCPDGLKEVEPQNAKVGKRKGYRPIMVII